MGANTTFSKLSACSLGIAFGITNGLGMMLLAWAAWQWGYGAALVNDISSVYHGYAATLMGGVLGAIWGFFDGLLFGLIAGWIYNLCLCCCCKKKS